MTARDVPFVKMSGAGNDFVVLHPGAARALDGALGGLWVRAVCARGTGVGADGVVVVSKGVDDAIDVVFRNPDGSEAFCGNGTRCAARFAVLSGMCEPKAALDTAVGRVESETFDDGSVRIVLPAPLDCGEHVVEVPGGALRGRSIDSGAPHFVVEIDDVERAPLDLWGPAVRRGAMFGESGTNFDVVSRAAASRPVSVRTWERGVEGETLACGTGVIAAAWLLGASAHGVDVRVRSGRILNVAFVSGAPGERRTALRGDARLLFSGRLDPKALMPPPP